MKITVAGTGERKSASIRPAENEDFKVLTIKRYFFSWKHWKGKAELYKLCLADEDDILGIMALTNIPGDKRIEIKLLASSKENAGSKKIYDGFAGCLIAYACRESVKRYAGEGCVSLIPKTELKPKYMAKYGMPDAGW